MGIKNFDDLEVWKKAHQIALMIYRVTKEFPKDEMYGITNQLRRSAVSVGANIAEGFGRFHSKDKARFYFHARGSLAEVQNFVLICRDLHLVTPRVSDDIFVETGSVYQMLNGLITATMKNLKY
jgi:four helix bundle protein